MEVCYGWNQTPVRLSSTRKYCGDEILARCKRHAGPFWLSVENTPVPVRGEACLQFACEVSAAYHNGLAHNALCDDGFCEDMQERERRIQAHMDEPNSSDSEGEWGTDNK